jgi:hypothetical protein
MVKQMISSERLTGIPSELREETAESTTCLRRPMMAIDAPCLPSCRDISYPIPDPPPVNKATFPLSISGLNGDSTIDAFFLDFVCSSLLAFLDVKFG